jgi:hypothetical protein
MRHENAVSADRKSLRSTIAWLSICLLAAGWGPMCDPEVRRLWAIFGAFGLSAALGLDVVQRARAVFRRRDQRNLVQQRIRRNLETMVAQGDSPTVQGVPVGYYVDDIALQDAVPLH